MSFGVNDVAAAGKLAFQLHKWGSSHYTSAYQEYRDFMHDVEILTAALGLIEGEVARLNAFPGSASFDLSTLEIAAGGVNDTLQRCEKLLRENPRFRWTQGFITNIEWNLDIAEHVRALQTRIVFHCTKINLVYQPLQIHLNSWLAQRISIFHADMQDQLQSVLRKLDQLQVGNGRAEEGRDMAPASVDEEIAKRFAVAAATRKSTGNFFRDCLDAVVFHSEAGTRNFVAEQPTLVRPTVTQYLNLLKAIWLLQQIRKNPHYRAFCMDTLSEAYIRQLDRRVDGEFRRFEGPRALQAPQLSELLLEPDDQFEIWHDLGIIDTSPPVAEATGPEVELFRAPLQSLIRNRSRELSVFRVGESRLRFAIVITNPHVAGTDTSSHELDCRKAILIPIYAHPKNQMSNSLSWKAGPEDSRSQELPFSGLGSLLKFQEAVTNFGVVEDLQGVCSIRAKRPFNGRKGQELGEKGRLQLWVYRKARSSTKERHNSMESAVASDDSSSRAWSYSYIRGRNPSSTMRSTANGGFLDRPVPPQLVVYTSSGDQLRIISIAIEANSLINPSLCDCSNARKTCRRVVIENENHDLKVKINEMSDNDDKFNVAVLGHPKHDDAAHTAEALGYNFVSLELDSVEAKEKLIKSFGLVANIATNAMTSYYRDLQSLRAKNVYG